MPPMAWKAKISWNETQVRGKPMKKKMPCPLLTLYRAFCLLPLSAAYVYKIMRLNDQSLTRQLVQKRDFTH